jgi:hypothetical protein
MTVHWGAASIDRRVVVVMVLRCAALALRLRISRRSASYASVKHLGTLAKKHDLRDGAAILAEVQAAVADWSRYAEAAKLSKNAVALIADRIAPPAATVAKAKP